MGIREDSIIEVSCPTCHVKKGDGCVYVNVPKPIDSPYNLKAQRRYRQNGLATLQPHQTRLYRYRALLADRARRANPIPEATRVQLAVAHAEREFDLREYFRLKEWLKQHAWIFWTPNGYRPDGTKRGESYAFTDPFGNDEEPCD